MSVLSIGGIPYDNYMRGKKFEQARLSVDLTQEELGILCNLTKQEISLYENGKRNPSDLYVEKLALVSGYTIASLISFQDALIYENPQSYSKRQHEWLGLYNSLPFYWQKILLFLFKRLHELIFTSTDIHEHYSRKVKFHDK